MNFYQKKQGGESTDQDPGQTNDPERKYDQYYSNITTKGTMRMGTEFFPQAVEVLKTLVIAIGAGLAIWGAINLMEGYGADNPGARSQGIKQFISNCEGEF